MEKRIQILVGFSARRNIGDFCHPRAREGDGPKILCCIAERMNIIARRPSE